jgi:polysaccharide pyruvyl transferase WcaK-like protein
MIKVLIKGFYGFGNFGDDILMLTTYKIVREIFPQAEIFIGSESKNPNYIHKFLSDVKIINSTENIKVDWTIHGGGGVFFDFTNHSQKYLLFNQFIKLIGYRTYKNLYEVYRTLKGIFKSHGFVKQEARAGLGIGIGTYTSSSNRFLSDIPVLTSFDILLVRDEASVTNAKKYNHSKNVYKSSDLAFLWKYWMPTDLKKTQEQESSGFILRDWVFSDNVSIMLSVAKALLDSGHQVKFFALDEDSDTKFIQSASAFGPVYCWNPVEMTIQTYLSEFKKCKLVISSRAHGAIVSACLGIPVCCVCIEPKLEQVAKMLSNSAQAITEPFKKEEILRRIEDVLQELPSLKEATSKDVSRNSNEMSEGISLFRNFVTAHRA